MYHFKLYFPSKLEHSECLSKSLPALFYTVNVDWTVKLQKKKRKTQ